MDSEKLTTFSDFGPNCVGPYCGKGAQSRRAYLLPRCDEEMRVAPAQYHFSVLEGHVKPHCLDNVVEGRINEGRLCMCSVGTQV